jgi:hypothetical protein
VAFLAAFFATFFTAFFAFFAIALCVKISLIHPIMALATNDKFECEYSLSSDNSAHLL